MGLKESGLRGSLRNISTGVSAIPDSVVSRNPDDDSSSTTVMFGLEVQPSTDWPDIGCKLSANQSGQTRAYIYRMSDDELIGDTDISGLSGGDTFTFGLSQDLKAGTDYSIAVDAEGSSYTIGFDNLDDTSSYPYTSPDIDIVGSTKNSGSGPATDSAINAHAFIEIGNTGF